MIDPKYLTSVYEAFSPPVALVTDPRKPLLPERRAQWQIATQNVQLAFAYDGSRAPEQTLAKRHMSRTVQTGFNPRPASHF